MYSSHDQLPPLPHHMIHHYSEPKQQGRIIQKNKRQGVLPHQRNINSTYSNSNNYTTSTGISNTNSRRKGKQEKQVEVNDIQSNKVKYDSSKHLQVLFQLHGSVWPRVYKYCFFNLFITMGVLYLKERMGINLSFSDKGHTFMSMMVSFLMVTRSNIAYSRYMEARTELSNAMRACRELISYATTFTRYDMSADAKQWRIDLAKRTIKMLRTVVSVLEYESTGNHAWKIPILSKEEKNALHNAVGKSNERSTMVLAMFLRTTISANSKYLETPLHVNKELRLYVLVSNFVHAYHSLMKLVSTPFPFPLVQMTRTFLFIWIFTLPFVLVNDIYKTPALIFIVFFITYAFIGLECVAIELDDPFGDDANDFDVLGLANVTFEDIYITIFDLDGDVAAQELRSFMDESAQKTKQMSITESLKNVNSFERPKHTRLSSITAYNIAPSQNRLEFGSETSVLLCTSTKGKDCQSIRTMDSWTSQRTMQQQDEPETEYYYDALAHNQSSSREEDYPRRQANYQMNGPIQSPSSRYGAIPSQPPPPTTNGSGRAYYYPAK